MSHGKHAIERRRTLNLCIPIFWLCLMLPVSLVLPEREGESERDCDCVCVCACECESVSVCVCVLFLSPSLKNDGPQTTSRSTSM